MKRELPKKPRKVIVIDGFTHTLDDLPKLLKDYPNVAERLSQSLGWNIAQAIVVTSESQTDKTKEGTQWQQTSMF